jgi:hypothetical protein
MFVKGGVSALKENKLLSHNKSAMNKKIQLTVSVGDQMKCPECETLGRVVWISQDKKTMGVKCHASHREMSRPPSKYGARVVPSTKTRKNVVFLTTVGS